MANESTTKRPSICQLIGYMVAKHNPRLYAGPMAELISADPDLTLEEIETLIPIFWDAHEKIKEMHRESLDLSQKIEDIFRAREYACLAREDEQILKYIQVAVKTLQAQLAEYPECAWCAGRGKKGTNRCPQCNELFPAQSALVAKLNEAMKARFGEENCLLCRKESDDVQFVVDALRAAGIEPDIFLQVAHDEFYTDFRLDLEIDSFGCLMSLSDFIFIAVKTFK